jgi:hypothetical protein
MVEIQNVSVQIVRYTLYRYAILHHFILVVQSLFHVLTENLFQYPTVNGSRDSVVGIATSYGLDD